MFRRFSAVRQGWWSIRWRRIVGNFILGMTDDSTVLIEFDATGKWTWSRGRRYGATRGDIALLVVRVLF
jgi:hypothetical protein